MAKNKDTGARNVKCDKCDMEGHSIPGTRHRRCGGQKGAPIRPKENKQPIRGVWVTLLVLTLVLVGCINPAPTPEDGTPEEGEVETIRKYDACARLEEAVRSQGCGFEGSEASCPWYREHGTCNLERVQDTVDILDGVPCEDLLAVAYSEQSCR